MPTIGYRAGMSQGVSVTVSSQYKYVVVSNEKIYPAISQPSSMVTYTATAMDSDGSPLLSTFRAVLMINGVKALDVDFSTHYNASQKLLTCSFMVPTAVGIVVHRVKLMWAEQ